MASRFETEKEREKGRKGEGKSAHCFDAIFLGKKEGERFLMEGAPAAGEECVYDVFCVSCVDMCLSLHQPNDGRRCLSSRSLSLRFLSVEKQRDRQREGKRGDRSLREEMKQKERCQV